jgi:hypothetical protein
MWKSVCDQLDFLLPRYAARAPEPERAAAAALREHLARLAAPAERPATGPDAPARRSRRRAPKPPAEKRRPRVRR